MAGEQEEWLQRPRGNFRRIGYMVQNELTGKLEEFYPRWRRHCWHLLTLVC